MARANTAPLPAPAAGLSVDTDADLAVDKPSQADGPAPHRGNAGLPQDAAQNTLILRLTGSTLPEIDIPLAAGPAPDVFTDLGTDMRWHNTMGSLAATPMEGTASAPAALQNTVNVPVASSTTALAAPQVLASGTWLANPQVAVKTSLGTIIAELFPNAAPVTAANYLAYVSSGFYDNLLFHRVVAGFVVQGGGYATGAVYQTPPYAPIVLESNNGLFNDRGTLAMARTDAANSATSQFFINLVNNNLGNTNNLNYISTSRPGYAVFGKVLTGLSVVDAIGAVSAPAPSNAPLTEVKILEADQTKQGTLHSTTGRVDLGILAADASNVWTGNPPTAWEYSLNAGASWAQAPGRGFTVAQGAYEAGSILVRYIGPTGSVGIANGTGGNMIVDSRAILAGDGSANSLTGTSAANTMYGLGGNDTLDGGSGNDSMVGGSGNDIYVVRDAGDRVVETSGGGTDRVNASVTFTLASNVEQLTLTGTVAINGTGNALSNRITGNTAINSLSGGSGNDTLDGGSGNDSLSGGAGLDTFRFSSALNSANADTLLDFSVADDRLELENTIFTKLTVTGAIASWNFRADTAGNARDINDFVLYETDTGRLFYDADGFGTGAKVLIATLKDLPALTSADIFVT